MKNAIKVLIVDDDKSSSAALAEVVRRMGLKAVVANKSADALNIVKLQTVHAAIVDVLLPKISGVDLVQEFRKTKFADSPVIFVSGVFKDRAFAAEAIKKAGASNFLFKPFGADAVRDALTAAISHLLNAEKWTVQTMLTRELGSIRDRAKAIEHLEQIKGYDFPFVLSMLMEAGVSGHLNLINEHGEIFGVKLIKGRIAEVDSAESQGTGILALISKGYLSQEDWDDFEGKNGRLVSLEKLVQDGYVSPHAVSEAKHEQIMADFRSISASASLQLNLVLQDKIEAAPRHMVRLDELFNVMESAQEEFFGEEPLRLFYQEIADAPFRLLAPPEDLKMIWGLPFFQDIKPLCRVVESGGSLKHALDAQPTMASAIFRGVHYLVLSRAVMFEDVHRERKADEIVDRFRKLASELQGKTPDKIFAYFGASASAGATVIESIFQEYVKSNHPDHLPKGTPAEALELSRKCFDLVKAAHEVMADDVKRNQLFIMLKSEASEKQARATEFVSKALEMIRSGQFSLAQKELSKAESEAPSARQFLLSVWAELKGPHQINKIRLFELQKKMETIATEDRKSAHYHMALGLVKKALGDASATICFEKALQLDSSFVEARRELNAPTGGPKKLDIFNDDITSVVSQLFRRKAE